MELSRPQIDGLGVALNEATLLGVEVDPDERIAAVTFAVLTLPAEGLPPADSRVQFVLAPIGRVAASLREGWWDDDEAPVVPFEIGELLAVVQSFRGQAIYGWNFIDQPAEDFRRWADRLSLDWHSGTDGTSHTIDLFQERAAERKHLDLRVWFDHVGIRDPSGNPIGVDEFVAGGKRWWDGLYSGDPRTEGHGIVPAGE